MIYKNYIWDFGGTLFNTYPAYSKQVLKILRNNSINEDYNYILEQAKKSKAHLVDELTKKYNLNNFQKQQIRKCENKAPYEDRSPFFMIKELLEKINKSGGYNFIYTHRSFHSAMELLYYYDMFDFFVDIISKDVGLERKPNSEGFIYIIKKYNLNKSNTLSIGDRKIDIIASKKAGINAALFGHRKINADIFFEDFIELDKILFGGE